jgi:glycine/D-amino acid oxidase-like deaminating enzyme
MQYDIAIIGAGIMGSSIAYQLSQNKQNRIIVLEQSIPGKPEKSSIGHSRITGRATGSECNAYIDLLPVSNQIYKELYEANSNIYYPGDCITFCKNHSNKLNHIIDQIDNNQIQAEIINHPRNKSKFDAYLRPLQENETAIIEKQTSDNFLGILDPTETTRSFQEIAKNNGVTFTYNQKVTNISRNDKGMSIEVECDQFQTELQANIVILAMNANTTCYPKLNSIISRQRIPLIFIPINNHNFKNSYLELTPEDKYELFVMPERVGNKIFLKAGIHHIAPYEDSSLSDDEFLIKMKLITLQKVRENFPFVKTTVISDSIMCEYALTPDGLPLIGELEKNVWIAAGFNGNGCKHAAAFGKILVKAVTEDSKGHIPKDFDPLRFF